MIWFKYMTEHDMTWDSTYSSSSQRATASERDSSTSATLWSASVNERFAVASSDVAAADALFDCKENIFVIVVKT